MAEDAAKTTYNLLREEMRRQGKTETEIDAYFERTREARERAEAAKHEREERAERERQEREAYLNSPEYLAEQERLRLEEEAWRHEQEEIQQKERQERLFRQFIGELPDRYRGYTLETFEVEQGSSDAFEAAKTLDRHSNLFLWGEAGNGKTHLAVATARRLVLEHYDTTARFWGITELFQAIWRSMKTGDLPPNLISPSVLVLDDFGKLKPSEFVYQEIYGALEGRWARGKCTIMTSNHRALETASRLAGDDVSAAAILSRLASGVVVEVKGDDRRLKK